MAVNIFNFRNCGNFNEYWANVCYEESFKIRENKQKETDKLIQNKFGSQNLITKFIAWISGTLGGPIISFFKKNGFSIALGILVLFFYLK